MNPKTEVDSSRSRMLDIRPSYRRNKIIAGGSYPPLVGRAQHIEHDDEHDTAASESGMKIAGPQTNDNSIARWIIAT
jgi:hypothetical protein